jgi:hypothetical protein
MDYRYFGAYRRGMTWMTENALEEIWERIRRFTGREFLAESFSEGISEEARRAAAKYALPRFRQACEFRSGAEPLALTSKPLLLYYSSLNLTRAFIAMKTGAAPSSAHGLTLDKGSISENILECATACTQHGSFTDLHRLVPQDGALPSRFTLRSCLAQIPELCMPYKAPSRGVSMCVPVFPTVRSAGRTSRPVPGSLSVGSVSPRSARAIRTPKWDIQGIAGHGRYRKLATDLHDLGTPRP